MLIFIFSSGVPGEERYSMKKLSIMLTCLPLLAAGAALAQTPTVVEDTDLLTPTQRALGRHPDLNPEWTWMREDQAGQVLHGNGYSDALSAEKHGAFWRGKAIKDDASYHVAINRYADVVGHMDHKSRLIVMSGNDRTAKALNTVLTTLNGNVAVPMSRMAPRELTAASPVPTIMGEVGWTWVTEAQAARILKGKGFTNIDALKRDERGIWRAKAIKDGLAFRVAIDVYSNVESQPDNHGGLAQGSPSQ
jgi:hypothetical protein